MTAARARAVLALAALALVLAACQGPAAPPPAAPGPSLASQAAEALDKGDYAKAADLSRRALADAPDSLPVHYGLAIAASHLNLRDEAIREFKWVMARGPAGSSEVEAARRWLASVGALAGDASSATTTVESRAGAGQASLEGRMVLAEPGQPPRPASRRMVILYGLAGTPTKDQRYNTRTDDNGLFRFPDLMPGPYMITDAVSAPRNWRLKIELRPGQAMNLGLTPGNGIKIRDDFPNLG